MGFLACLVQRGSNFTRCTKIRVASCNQKVDIISINYKFVCQVFADRVRYREMRNKILHHLLEEVSEDTYSVHRRRLRIQGSLQTCLEYSGPLRYIAKDQEVPRFPDVKRSLLYIDQNCTVFYLTLYTHSCMTVHPLFIPTFGFAPLLSSKRVNTGLSFSTAASNGVSLFCLAMFTSTCEQNILGVLLILAVVTVMLKLPRPTASGGLFTVYMDGFRFQIWNVQHPQT